MKKRPLIIPKKIAQGDTVRLIAPAGFVSQKQLDYTTKTLEKLGLKTIYSKIILKKTGYLAGSDSGRLNDLHAAFLCKKSQLILCIRGGYGTMRLLKNIDYDLIRQHPKIIIGYSDITALLQAIYKYSGLVGFHGVVGISAFTAYTKSAFGQILMQPSNQQLILNYQPPENKNPTPYIIQSGKATGILAGGNLSMLVALLGTPYDISWKGKLIFIEEINEYPYKIDKFLTQLLLAGKLQEASGLILGVFNACDIDGENTKREKSFSLQEVLTERLKPLNIPILYGFSFGHISRQAIFPIGILAEMNTHTQSVRLLESCLLR